jgi:hypothetical protein
MKRYSNLSQVTRMQLPNTQVCGSRLPKKTTAAKIQVTVSPLLLFTILQIELTAHYEYLQKVISRGTKRNGDASGLDACPKKEIHNKKISASGCEKR